MWPTVFGFPSLSGLPPSCVYRVWVCHYILAPEIQAWIPEQFRPLRHDHGFPGEHADGEWDCDNVKSQCSVMVKKSWNANNTSQIQNCSLLKGIFRHCKKELEHRSSVWAKLPNELTTNSRRCWNWRRKSHSNVVFHSRKNTNNRRNGWSSSNGIYFMIKTWKSF